jgi:hypothetical protein
MHFIAINTYVPYSEETAQYNWFVEALSKVNRTRTPWLVIAFHAAPRQAALRRTMPRQTKLHLRAHLRGPLHMHL